jgi:N-acetylneuraminate synthase
MIKIGGRTLTDSKPPFLIAEISANHKKSLSRALKLVRMAAKSGFDAVKLQTYEADKITLKSKKKDFRIKDKKSIWYNKNLFELYQKGQTPKIWHKKIFNEAKKLGLVAFSTPFDLESVEFLKKLKVPCYKISSFEITYLDLIKECAKTKKPIIISTGLAKFSEIKKAISEIKKMGNNKIILLKCSSSYPANPEDINLKTLLDLKKRFKLDVGLSDHTIGSEVAIASIPYGVKVIEKHVTINNNDGALDSKFALPIKEFSNFVNSIKNTHKALGKIKYGPTKNEKNSLSYRRSIYVSKNIKKGERISEENIKIVRPSLGMPIRYYKKILGKRTNKSFNPGDVIKLKNLKRN